MALARSTLITRIKEFYVRGDITDTQWAAYLDLALDHAQAKYNWHDLHTVGSYSTEEDVETVALNANIRVLINIRLEQTSPVTKEPLAFLPWDEFRQDYQMGTDLTGEPQHYTIFGKTIYLGPIPDAEYTLGTMETRWARNTFADGTDATESPVSNLDTYLILFATAWGYMTKDMSDLSEGYMKLAQDIYDDARHADQMLVSELRTSGMSAYEITTGSPITSYYERPS